MTLRPSLRFLTATAACALAASVSGAASAQLDDIDIFAPPTPAERSGDIRGPMAVGSTPPAAAPAQSPQQSQPELQFPVSQPLSPPVPAPRAEAPGAQQFAPVGSVVAAPGDVQTDFAPVTREQLEAQTAGRLVYFLPSDSGFYSPELAQCQKIDSEGLASYECGHTQLGVFYTHMVGSAEQFDVVYGQTAAAPLIAAEPLPAADTGGFEVFGFRLEPYVAARAQYALGSDISPDSVAPSTNTGGFGGTVSAGVGTRVGGVILRLEGEGGFRSYTVENNAASATPEGSLSQATFMANLIAEFEFSRKLMGYAGAGAGLARTSYTDTFINGSTLVTGETSGLAYQAFGGVGYKVTDKLAVFGEYRQVIVPGAFQHTYADGSTYEEGMSNGQVAVGVRYSF